MTDLANPKICIIGAGAIGGFLGAQLAQNYPQVNVIARSETLRQLQTNGWFLESAERRIVSKVNAVSDASTLGPQDYVFLTVKSYSLNDISALLPPLLGPHTLVIPVINGIPWWFKGQHLEDPLGSISSVVPPHQILGAVAYPACQCNAPGQVKHNGGTRLFFGEPHPASESAITLRLQNFVAMLTSCGLDAIASEDIATEVWKKLLGNACFNPVSLLTNSSTDLLIDDPLVYELFKSMMAEIMDVGTALGIHIETSIADRIAATRKLGNIKTSMLQDAEAGKFVEIEAILGSVLAIGKHHHISTPTLQSVFALARMRSETMGLLKASNGNHS